MATLSDNQIPGLGNGILHPNLRYKFVVQFLNGAGELLPYQNGLSKQVISVDSIMEFREWSEGTTSIVFQDDVTNEAFKGLLKLQQEKSLTIAIHQMDGAGQILRSTLLKNAQVECFSHSDLDYAGSSDDTLVKMDAYFPSTVGSAIDEIRENPIAAAILTALSGANLKVRVEPSYTSAANELVAQITFEETDYTFANTDVIGLKTP